MKKLLVSIFILTALAVSSYLAMDSKQLVASSCCEGPSGSSDGSKPKPKEKKA